METDRRSKMVKAKVVIYMSGSWRLSHAKYVKLLKLIASGKSWDLGELGTYLGPIATPNDFSAEYAKSLLKEIEVKRLKETT